MKENVIIRNERKEDWEIVETITRQAFYNPVSYTHLTLPTIA